MSSKELRKDTVSGCVSNVRERRSVVRTIESTQPWNNRSKQPVQTQLEIQEAIHQIHSQLRLYQT
jgi:hypothetical protein